MNDIKFFYGGMVVLAVLVAAPCKGQDLPEQPSSGGVLGSESDPPGEPDETINQMLDRYAEFDLDEIEKTVEAFLKSKTVSERVKYVRNGQRVRPLMKKFYGGEKIQAEGLEKFDKSEVSFRGGFLTTMVETGNYSTDPIAVERIEGKEIAYRVDWESWVGFCEVSPGEMKVQRPADPVLVRAIVSADHYFNFDFADDKKWKSYKLVFRHSEETFAGYAKVNSTAAKQLLILHKENQSSPYLLRVAYPPGGRSKSQVEIVEVVESGWISGMSEKKKDGK